MAHKRKLIRDNIVTALTGLTTTGSRVYASRVYPLDAGKIPGLCVYSKSESSEYLTISSDRTIRKTASFAIEAYAKATDNTDDVLDQICLEVETALAADRTRGGYARDTRVLAFESKFSGGGEQPVAVAEITVEVMYIATEMEGA